MVANLITAGEYVFLEEDRQGVLRRIERNVGISFNASTSYGQMVDWSPAGDWMIEFDMYLNDDTIDEQTILDGTAFRVFVDGFVDQGTATEKGNPILEFEQAAVPATRDFVPTTKERSANEKWLNVSVSYIGGVLTLAHRNDITSQETITIDAITLKRIGSKDDSTGWCNGRLRRLKLTDLTTPANSRIYAFQKQVGDYVQDLLTNEPDLNVPASWGVAPAGVTTDTVNNKITMNGTQADAASVTSGINSTAGEHYIVKFTIEPGSQGQIQIKTDDANDAWASAVGNYDYIEVITTGRSIDFISGSGANKFNGVISNISIISTSSIILVGHNPTHWYQN